MPLLDGGQGHDVSRLQKFDHVLSSLPIYHGLVLLLSSSFENFLSSWIFCCKCGSHCHINHMISFYPTWLILVLLDF